VNRILRISTDRWVTGRAIRWACEYARVAELGGAIGRDCQFTRYGTHLFAGDANAVDTAIVITVERDNGN
jgi:hypothetical protein